LIGELVVVVSDWGKGLLKLFSGEFPSRDAKAAL
jgi:hypothetical protein